MAKINIKLTLQIRNHVKIMTMKLIVGLGNPEKRYAKTRHNVGFMVLDSLASRIINDQSPNFKQILNSNFQFQKKLDSEVLKYDDLVLAKPQTMMNDSGKAVAKLATFYKLQTSDIYIAHDDLDIKLGEYKITKRKGPKEHKGLLGVYEKLGTKDFWHVRVGVDNRSADNRIPGEDYVLQDFKKDEREVINKVVSEVSDKLMTIVANNKL